MGFTNVKVRVINPKEEGLSIDIETLVDTGALYSSIPKELLEGIRVGRRGKKVFRLANGEMIERDIGAAIFSYNGFEGISPVIFGEKKDTPILGVVTLEAMGVEVDPVKNELHPMELLLV